MLVSLHTRCYAEALSIIFAGSRQRMSASWYRRNRQTCIWTNLRKPGNDFWRYIHQASRAVCSAAWKACGQYSSLLRFLFCCTTSRSVKPLLSLHECRGEKINLETCVVQCDFAAFYDHSWPLPSPGHAVALAFGASLSSGSSEIVKRGRLRFTVGREA